MMKIKLKPWNEIPLWRKVLRVWFIGLIPLKIILIMSGVSFGVTYLLFGV
jgi:hypothetical protein